MQNFREIFGVLNLVNSFFPPKYYGGQSKYDCKLDSAYETLVYGFCLMQMGTTEDCSCIKWVEDENHMPAPLSARCGHVNSSGQCDDGRF